MGREFRRENDYNIDVCLSTGEGKPIKYGALACSLCSKFKDNAGCSNCPLGKNGYMCTVTSPWGDFCKLVSDNTYPFASVNNKVDIEMVLSAQKMLDCLEFVLKEEEAWTTT